MGTIWSMKLLIVEDEHRVADNIARGFEMHKATVDVAYDGETGLTMALSGDYDVIILDRMLPKIDGVSVCVTLRQEQVQTPILMLTALSEINDRVEGLDAGADDYLGKPFAFVELQARVTALMRRSTPITSSVITVDTLEIDTLNSKVKRAGKTLDLTRKEYALLEYLARHAGQVLSPEHIIERVWNYDTEVLNNTAQVYIGYLRRKVDKAFEHEKQLIHTARGFGYTLEAR
jgi:DNA-binding response OmpR family regulator